MESEPLCDISIFWCLKPEFHDILHQNKNLSIEQIYKNFIIQKDIGLICTSFVHDIYVVTDSKKFMLAKIKYGI